MNRIEDGKCYFCIQQPYQSLNSMARIDCDRGLHILISPTSNQWDWVNSIDLSTDFSRLVNMMKNRYLRLLGMPKLWRTIMNTNKFQILIVVHLCNKDYRINYFNGMPNIVTWSHPADSRNSKVWYYKFETVR